MGFSRQLNESKSVVLNSSGNGEVQLGPAYYQERWEVTNASVRIVDAVRIPSARLYLDSAVPGNMLAATYDGSSDSAVGPVTLHSNQRLICVWLGGDPGATATLSVYGTMYHGGE